MVGWGRVVELQRGLKVVGWIGRVSRVGDI